MKLLKVALPVLIIAVALMCWVGLSDADSADLWPNKSGELCWDIFKEDPPGTLVQIATVKLAIVRTFKDHYIVHGTITENGYIRCLNGNAEVVDNIVIMHGNTSGIYPQDDPQVSPHELIGGMGLVELRLSDLGGTSLGIDMWYDTDIAGSGEVKHDGPRYWQLTQCN